ncbi:MAG: CAP domain-containing protein [Deltaproteobacteria bacterium]|nr:CAP domain-containing protein [Deltaproteobacteria bacterium]MDQ3296117.1 CAP domain-containing protein [Myxococcota bacterium]
MHRLIVTLAAVLLFTGCAGEAPPDISQDPASEAPDPAQPAPLDDTDPLDDDGADETTGVIYATLPLLDADEVAFLAKLNAYRRSLGKPALRASVALTHAANFHSKDMAVNDHFSHDSSDGTTFGPRVKRYYGYNTAIGENIAFGYQDAAAVFTAWKNSPGHDANMRGDYSVIGISKVLDADGTPYWTTDFGGFRDAILSAGVSTILSNAGFESTSITANVDHAAVRTLQRWHTYASGGGTATRRAGSQEAGSFGLRTVDVTAGKSLATQVVRAAAGVRYEVSARTRHVSGASQQTLYLDFLRADFTRISVVTANTGTATTWATTSVLADAPSGTRYVKILLYAGSGADAASTHDWDTVKLTAR